MKAEKYYGIINPGDTTTKIDTSNIDCELPGPTNPSTSGTLNTSSILDNIGTLKSYVKLADCPLTFTISNHNDAVIDSSLMVYKTLLLGTDGNTNITYKYILFSDITIGTAEQVYIGYEDSDKIFKGNVTSVMTTSGATLDSDTTDCSAVAKYIKNDNTGMPIKYSLNKCTADRTITFSYKNIPIFKIKLTYTKTYDTLYIWKVSTGSTVSDSIAFFEYSDNMPLSFSGSTILKFFVYTFFDLSTTSSLVYFTPSTKFSLSEYDVNSLKKSGKLIHVQGHDYLNDSTNYDSLTLNKLTTVNTYNYNTDTFGTTNVTLSMKIYIYKNQTPGGFYRLDDTILFNDTSNSNHIGVYKYLRS